MGLKVVQLGLVRLYKGEKQARTGSARNAGAVVAVSLGHESATTTTTRYAKPEPSEAARQLGALRAIDGGRACKTSTTHPAITRIPNPFHHHGPHPAHRRGSGDRGGAPGAPSSTPTRGICGAEMTPSARLTSGRNQVSWQSGIVGMFLSTARRL